MINVSLGLEKQKVQRWASRGEPHGVLPLPRGLSLRPLLHHGSCCLCQICFPVPRTTPWHLPGIHQFRPTSCGSFPAAVKPPWLNLPDYHSPFFLSHLSWKSCLFSLSHFLTSLSLFHSVWSGSPPPPSSRSLT